MLVGVYLHYGSDTSVYSVTHMAFQVNRFLHICSPPESHTPLILLIAVR